MKVNQYNLQVAPSQRQALQAKANVTTGMEEQALAQGMQGLAQGMNNVGSVATQALARRNELEIQDTLQQQQAEFDSILDAFKSNKNVLSAEKEYEEAVKQLQSKGRGALTFKGMQTDYDMAFDNMAQSYRNQFDGIRRERVQADLVAFTDRQLEGILKNVGTTRESAREAAGEGFQAILDSSVAYTPEQLRALQEDFGEQVISTALKGRVIEAFNAAEGSYLDKGDAARQALLSQDIDGDLSAADQEQYFSLINSLVSQEHTMQGWREKESDDQDYEGFNELFMFGTRTGNFLAAKEYCHNADTYNESLPITWLKMIEAEEARLASGSTSYKIPEMVYTGLVEIAMNTEKDEAWKHRESIAYMTDQGVLPSAFDTGLTYINALSKKFQNPIFEMGQKELANYFEPLIEDGKAHDDMKGQELQTFYFRQVMGWDELLRNGNYTAEQMPQVLANYMDETKKLAIEMEFEMKHGINTPDELHPENLDKIKNLPDMIQLAHDGRLLGVRGEFGDAATEYETFYDIALGKVMDQDAIPGLQKIGGQYLSDATPRYLADVGGSMVDIRMMPDGTMEYWMDYGDGSGEWAGMEYEFLNPLEAKELQPTLKLVETPENPAKPEVDYLAPPDNSGPVTLPWSPNQLTAEDLAKELEGGPAPAIHDALRGEIKDEIEKGDFNVFGQIRNKKRNDWMDRYNLNPAELRDMIRAVKEGE